MTLQTAGIETKSGAARKAIHHLSVIYEGLVKLLLRVCPDPVIWKKRASALVKVT